VNTGRAAVVRPGRLLELTVTDLALIDRLRLELDAGFNVITGETGAGKSLLIDALGLALGARADTSLVRHGADAARVEALFDRTPEPFIVAREVSVVGRSTARLDDETVTAARLAEEVGAQLVPLARRFREERLRSGPPLLEHALDAAVVVLGRRGGTHLLADQGPQPCRRGLERLRQAVVARGAVAARGHPGAIGQRLEVAAHGGLRQLQHGAQLGHRQLVAFQQQQHAAPHRIGQCRQVVEHLRQVGLGGRREDASLLHP